MNPEVGILTHLEASGKELGDEGLRLLVEFPHLRNLLLIWVL